MFAKFNSEVQTLMIDATNLLIMKLFDVSSINNNILFSINIMTIIVLITTDADNFAITISSIIFKNKSIKSKIMRVYKDQSVNEHVR